jgi:hypothetical protein
MRSVPLALCAVLSLNIIASGQQQQSRERLVSVHLSFHARAPVYSSASEEFGFFEGETPRLTVMVLNDTSAPLGLGRPGRAWTDDLEMSIQPVTRQSVVIRARSRRSVQAGTVLPAGRGDTLRMDLLPYGQSPLPPGRYRVKAALGDGALSAGARGPNNVLAVQAEFEVGPSMAT